MCIHRLRTPGKPHIGTCHSVRDKGAVTDAGIEEAVGLQLAIGIQNGGPVDADRLRQFAFGRERITRKKFSDSDLSGDLLINLAVSGGFAAPVNLDAHLKHLHWLQPITEYIAIFTKKTTNLEKCGSQLTKRIAGFAVWISLYNRKA